MGKQNLMAIFFPDIVFIFYVIAAILAINVLGEVNKSPTLSKDILNRKNI